MNGLHAVMVPFPAQGSINPLMNLAHLLSSRGVFITFVDVEWSHDRMIMSRSAAAAESSTFKFLTIPDGLPPDHPRLSNLPKYVIAMENLGPVMEHHLLSSLSDGKAPPITCIITENFMSCTYEVANKLGVPRVIFWTMCAASSIAQRNANLLASRGHIPPTKVGESKKEENLITCLPGNLPPILASDLFSFYRSADHTSDVLYQWALREAEIEGKADYVLVNTFDELEPPETVSALSCNGCPALAVGPVFLPNFFERRDLNGLASMLEQDDSCLKWLDTREKGSVIYVSFGSLALKSKEQLEELALGLEKSERPFLWVLRRDIAGGIPATLPEGFAERTKDRGLIAKWVPQFKVLSHPSVGGFVSHSGWNSCLESISMGIPMLGWPFFADQFLDCRFCKDVWKIGLNLEGVDVDENLLVRREEIERGLRRLMGAEELRKRGRELKEAALKAVGEAGGSSFLNLNKFVDDMKQLFSSGASVNKGVATEAWAPATVQLICTEPARLHPLGSPYPDVLR